MQTALGYRKRRHRYEGEGHGRYLTFSCFHNQPFLQSDRACTWLVEGILEAKSGYPFDLWAWVFMADHVHLLIHPREEVAVGRILRAIKEPVSKRVANWVRKHAPHFVPRMSDTHNGRPCLRFWQPGGGYDRNIVSPAELREKINYIHCNPVRRGLVGSPADWRWSSYAAWQYGTDDPLPIDRGTVPPLG